MPDVFFLLFAKYLVMFGAIYDAQVKMKGSQKVPN